MNSIWSPIARRLARVRRARWSRARPRAATTATGRQPERLRQGGVAAHRLLAGVEDDARRRRPAGHRGQHGQRQREVDVVVRAVVHVAEDAAADLHLGDARLPDAVGEGAGAAAAHDVDVVAGAAAGLGARGQQRRSPSAHRALLLGRVGDRDGVALPAHHAGEAQARPLARSRRASATTGCARGDAGAVHADIDLDHHAQLAAAGARRRGQLGDVARGCRPRRSGRPGRSSSTSRAILSGPTIWLAIRMSRMPAAAITSASPSLAQVTPMAPAAISCGRSPASSAAFDVRPPADAVLAAGRRRCGRCWPPSRRDRPAAPACPARLGQADQGCDASLIGRPPCDRGAAPAAQ